MDTEIRKILENIRQSGVLVLEHYRSRGFKNTMIEVGLKNIIELAQGGIDQIEKGKEEVKGDDERREKQ
jgi:hypothetical protein